MMMKGIPGRCSEIISFPFIYYKFPLKCSRKGVVESECNFSCYDAGLRGGAGVRNLILNAWKILKIIEPFIGIE
jgi:hypothetical protein